MSGDGIAQFVADRLTEAEQTVKGSGNYRPEDKPDSSVFHLIDDDYKYPLGADPAAALNMVAALRRIADMHHGEHECPNHDDEEYRSYVLDGEVCSTMRALVGMWAGHPDYDTTWEQR